MGEPVPAHAGSGEVENAVLDLFSIPKTDTSIHSYRMVTVHPISRSITPIEFNIPGGRDHIDLTRSYFRMELKLKLANGGNIADANAVFPAPNLFHTIIKQPVVTLNGTTVSEQTDTYAYKAFLETIMNYDQEAADTYLQMQGFYFALDHPPELNNNKIDITSGNGAGHAEFQALSEEQKKAVKSALANKMKVTDGKTLVLLGKPHIDIFNVKRLLPPQVDLKMKFFLNDPSFFMNGTGAAARLVDEDIKMTFVACMVRVRSDKFTAISLNRARGMSVYYPTVRSEIRVHSIPPNTRYWEETNLFSGRIPDRLIVGLVHQDAFNGKYQQNPFCFEKFNVKSIKQVIEGEEYPYETLELNHDNGDLDMDGYHRLVTAGCLASQGRCMIKPEHWGHAKTCTLFMWDNVASGCSESDVFNPRQDGRCNVVIQFGANNNHVINVIVYGEYENMMEIKPEGSIFYDIYNQRNPM